MFNFFKKQEEKKLQGYKVTNTSRTKKYGIAADSLHMLKEKSCQKFQMKNCKLYLSQDGSLIEDNEYFSTIPPQTLFIVANENDIVKTDFELLLESIKIVNADILNAGELAKQFVSENKQELSTIITKIQQEYNEKTAMSKKFEHPEWFKGGSDDKAQTKEEVMSRKSRDRIRGYFYKTKDDITKSDLYRNNVKAREIFEEILFCFNILLNSADYFSCLFDRKFKRKFIHNDNKSDVVDAPLTKKMKISLQNHTKEIKLFDNFLLSLCSDSGDFYCQGVWDENSCQYTNHTINPYSSRENSIIFQTWNLDHQIELSRTIIPSLIDNVKMIAIVSDQLCKIHNKNIVNISVIEYFFKIFTLDNLKLVHIICHDKSKHDFLKKFNGKVVCIKCNDYSIIKNLKNEIEKK